MKSWPRHPFRLTGRLIWLAGELLLAALNYIRLCAFPVRMSWNVARGEWLQHASGRLLRVFHLEIQSIGRIPSHGLLICNHLSYLDILVLAALTPCVFVAKSEVKSWPVFGWFARMAGTLFVRREKRSDVSRITAEIKTVLDEGTLLILFPEGTSSNGESVLPFKSALLEPAATAAHPLQAACIGYALEDGDVAEEVCYWKDMTLFPHLLNLLSKNTVRASIQFTQLREGSTDRKELARRLHSEVMKLKEAVAI